jgi:DNA-directed RNA polymerase subunit RPC12/RpoP
MTNARCPKCGGRWLPKEPDADPGPCPWCEIKRLRAELAARPELTDEERAHRAVTRYWEAAEAAESVIGIDPGSNDGSFSVVAQSAERAEP